jgi:HSP20 family molecular chaperone IbpA
MTVHWDPSHDVVARQEPATRTLEKPGPDRKVEIDLTVEGRTLTLRGEREIDTDVTEEQFRAWSAVMARSSDKYSQLRDRRDGRPRSARVRVTP